MSSSKSLLARSLALTLRMLPLDSCSALAPHVGSVDLALSAAPPAAPFSSMATSLARSTRLHGLCQVAGWSPGRLCSRLLQLDSLVGCLALPLLAAPTLDGTDD